MCDKAASDRQSICFNLLENLPSCFLPNKITDKSNSIEELSRIIRVVSDCNEGQACYKAAERYVVPSTRRLLEGSGTHFIFLPPQSDSCDELNVVHLLSLLAFQKGDTACLEEIASHLHDSPSDGYLMTSVGVVLNLRMKYELSEECFLSALSYFQHEQNYLGTVVATVNLAAFHKVRGDYKKAQSYCDAAVKLCWDTSRTPLTDIHLMLKVVFRLAPLSRELADYKSYHDILRVAVKFHIDGISGAFALKYMKQLMTLQLKEHEGERIKRDELEEFALRLFAADAFMKAQPLTADFITTVMTLAEMYCTIKCLREARQLIDKLEAEFLCFYGGNGPLFGFLQYQIGHFKVKYCKASEAQSALQKAEEIFSYYFGRGYPIVGSCKSLQGTCALQKGNLKEVHHHLKEARILFEKLNHHHPEVGEILLKLADLESKAGNLDNSKLIIEEALEIFISACGKVSIQTALAYLQDASILQRKGKFMRSALDKVKKANDIFVHHGLHHDHPDVAFCHYLRGQFLHSLGQVKEAEEEFLFVHHQLSSRDDLSMKIKVIAPELYRMFFVVDADGLALRGSCCSHFLSLVSLADMKTGDEKRGHMKEIFNCLEELDSTVLTVSDYVGKYVHCTLQRILEANVQVYFTLILDSATSLGEDESFSSKYSGKEKKQPGDYDNVYLLSSCSNNGKGPQFLIFWKTSDVLETGDISCVTSSFRESVKLLCLQPKFRKTFLEGQELFMKLPTQEQSPSVSSLSSQIDSLPLLVELELSKSHNLCDSIDSFPTASAVWPLAHVSYFSYRFSSSDKALLVFYKWFSSLGRKLELSEVRSISTPEVSSPSQRNCAVHFTFIDPICASLSLAVEDGSVLVKCRTVKESGSTCICSSVRSALESTAEAWVSDVVGSVLEQSLWLPCVEDGADYGKKRTKCYSDCKDSQKESSSFSDQKLDIRPQTNWEQDSDILKKEPSVDLSQNEDTECPSFTAHPDDTLGTDVCVQLLECILRNRQLSLDKQLSGINNQLHTTDGTEEHVNSLLFPVSSSSLNCLPSSQYDATNEKPEFKPEALPCVEDVIEETCAGKEAGNVSDTPSTSQAVFFNSYYSESAAEKSNCEEGLIADNHPSPESKENLLPNVVPQEACSVKGVGTCFHKEESREDQGIEIDQSPGPSFTTVGRENDKGTVAINGLVCELQDEVAFYQDQCRELREEVVELKEKWKLSEDEKQDLQAEVGRQLFLESKEKRSIKIYQPPSEYASGTSMPGRVRGASHDFSGMGARLLGGAGPLNNSGFLFQQRLQEISNSLSELELSRIKSLVQPLLDCLRLARIREGSELFEELERKGELSCSFIRYLLRRIHRFDLVEKLAVPFHNGDESYREESYLSQEKNQQNEGSESVSGVDGKQADEVEEWNDIFDNTEADGEVQFSNSSNINPFNSDSEVAAVTFHAEIINESSFVDMDLSKERCDSASSLSQSFDVPSIGVVSEERSQSLSVTGEQFESGELKGACGAGNERGREGSYESSLLDGAEGQFNFNHHFIDIVDGAVNLPDRAQHSLMLEDFTGENQDSLPYGDTTQRQNVSGTRITVKKDRAVDQSDSHVSNESNKWEHLGARPRDRPPKIDRSSETSLLYSLENLVPPQVGGPVAQGVANAFLARHSEDKHLHKSLYYTNAEEIFTENSSLPGASHVDGMKNLMDSNKAKQNLGDCQSARRPDSYNQPHSSLFHQAGGVYIGGNNGLNTDFNLLNPIIANDFAPCTRMQDGTFPYLQRDELHSGFTGSGLTSDFMQTTGSQTGAFNTSNSNFSVTDYALGTKEPQIPPDGHFTSLQINQPPQPGFNGSGFSFDLTGTTGHEMTPSATVTHRNSDLSGSSSMLPSTTNLGLLGTSSVNMQTYDYRPDASPTVSSGARADVDGKQSFVEERKEIFDNTEIDGEVQFCNSSNVPSFNSNSEVAAVSFHAEIVDESSFVDVDLSKERCDSASTLSQSFDVPTFGEESQERSLSPSVADKEFESGELKGACVARDERDREGSYESSANDGAEGHVQFNFNDHFNGTVDGAVNLPDRGQESIMTVDFTIVNQDCLPFGDTIQRQCVTGAGIIAQKDTVTDQSDSHVGNQSNKWEHLGARPRDRLFPTVQRSPEPSLPYSSFLNLAPRQVAGPEAHGVASAFLERHSEDENLHKSLYYTNAQLLTENSSFQGASLVDSTINLTNSNQFRPYIGDAAFRPEPISQTQYSLLFPQTGGADRIRTPSMCEEEREIRTERGLQTTTLVVESLDSTHNSHRASEEGIKAAVARIQSRWPWFGRWCCTCANGLHNNQDVDAICTDCFKYKYCGPCRVRPQNGHDDRCIFLQDAFSGIQVLPFYRVYLQCLVWLTQRNIIRCPACGHNFFPQG